MKTFEKHLNIATPITAVDLLSSESGFSKNQIKEIMQKGAVWLTHKKHTARLRRAKRLLQVDDELHCYYNEEIINSDSLGAKLIEDANKYSVWNKPSGMLSQGSKWGDHTTIYRWAEQNLEPQRDAFIVHRLDKAASGLILIAHSKKMAAYFSDLFQKGQIQKHYKAHIKGQLTQEMPFDIASEIEGKSAHSIVSLISYDADKDESILNIEIKTGRKHQIRIHLSSINHPIIGDRLYGDGLNEVDLQLTAWKLSFACPMSKYKRSFELEG